MSKVLTIKRAEFGFFTSKSSRERIKSASPNCSVFSMRECRKANRSISSNCRGSVDFSPKGIIIFLTSTLLIVGAVYLYQVNDLATKGFEIKEIEDRIKKLKEDNEKNKIREVELRSMYNIEKATEELNLVNPNEISYLNIGGSMAMK